MSNLSVQCSDCLFFIRYKNLKETEAKKEITILRLLIPLIFLVNPALIMMSQEKAEHKRKLLSTSKLRLLILSLSCYADPPENKSCPHEKYVQKNF